MQHRVRSLAHRYVRYAASVIQNRVVLIEHESANLHSEAERMRVTALTSRAGPQHAPLQGSLRRLYVCLALFGLCLSMGCETMSKNMAADEFAGRLPPQKEVLE